MTEPRPLPRRATSTPAQRDAQTKLIRSTFLGSLSKDMLTGPFFVAFAVQVMQFSDGQISTMLALLPLVVLLRYPFLDRIRSYPRRDVTIAARFIQLACLLLLLCLPTDWISLPVLFGIAALFVFGNEFLQNAVWTNFVAEVTARGDRGAFLGRLRTGKQFTNLAFALFGWLLVGDLLDRTEHSILLVVVILLLLNSLYWLFRIPSQPPPGQLQAFSGKGHFWSTLRHSRLLRRPLALAFIIGILHWPILTLYLVGTLNMPASILMLSVVANMLGPIFSVFIWGRQADRHGERRIFLLYFTCVLGLYPILLLVPDFATVPDHGRAWFIGVGAILGFNFLAGILDAGQMMAGSMYQARYVNDEDGFHAINILTAANQLFMAGLTALGGLVLSFNAGGGVIRFGPLEMDLFRALTLLIVTLAIAAGAAIARGIPED
ncbi:MFS transporter [Oceanomicrobium pacificus]|uniref:MFS transporter n=1 Tax=Oceanomicrobium pacificus TaxID=2692916 RepID=A0A6B0TVU8_9RHOB|nr:MFS transporter [Oceanomicrobium pacificus]MXU65113.1 hypothetical protein [Oceanomicrobium pacificus]